MLTDFQNFCTVGKPIKFATKPIWHYPPHLRRVATLPWKIKNSIFLQIFSRYVRKCKQVAFLSPLHYLGKLKIQMFSRYSADMEENAKKIVFKCIDFNLFPRVTVYAVCCVR